MRPMWERSAPLSQMPRKAHVAPASAPPAAKKQNAVAPGSAQGPGPWVTQIQDISSPATAGRRTPPPMIIHAGNSFAVVTP
jgi:hypothetical protein